MGKIAHPEALRRIGDLIKTGHGPAVVVTFRLDDAGALMVDVGATGGIHDELVEAALEMALAGNATAELVYGRPPRVGGAVRGVVEHHQRGPVVR